MPAVHLGTTGSPSGTHFFFNLQTGRVIRRHQWTPRPYSSSELKSVEHYAQNAPDTVVFVDRRGVPIEDDDDATIATSLTDDGGEDEFEYPSIPVDSDDDSDYDDESYASSTDEESLGGPSDDDGSTDGPPPGEENRSDDEVSEDGSSLGEKSRSERSSASDDSSTGSASTGTSDGDVADEDSAIATTRFGRRVRAPANLRPTALGGDYASTRQGTAHAADQPASVKVEPAPHPDLVRHMLKVRMGDHDSVAAIRDMHIAGEATKDDYAAALGCYKRMVDKSWYVHFESQAVNSFVARRALRIREQHR